MSTQYPILDNRPINKWKVAELKEELKRRKLMTKGLKDDLVKRLDEAISKERGAFGEEASKGFACDPEPMVNKSEDAGANPNYDILAEDAGAKPNYDKLAEDAGADAEYDKLAEYAQSHDENETGKMDDVTAVDGIDDGPIDLGQRKVQEGETVVGPDTAEVVVELAVSEVSAETNSMVNETVVTQIASSEEALEGNKIKMENEDTEPPPMDAVLDVSNPNIQVYEVSPVLGSQVKSESISTDSMSINEKNELRDNLNSDNVHLEVDFKLEMVHPSSSGDPPSGGNLHPLDDQRPCENQGSVEETYNKESTHVDCSNKNDSADAGSSVKLSHFSADDSMKEDVLENKQIDSNYNSNEVGDKIDVTEAPVIKDECPAVTVGPYLSPEEMETSAEENTTADYVKERNLEDDKKSTHMDFSKKSDMVDGGFLEKLNLDHSPADDFMEEDALETKQIDSNHNSSEVGEEATKVESTVDTLGPGKSYVKMESAFEKKDDDSAPSEKRKFQDDGIGIVETPPKRQRRWNSENLKIPEPQSSNLKPCTTPKNSHQTTRVEHGFNRSDSTLSGDEPKERVVPPSPKPPTNSLRIDRFLRPFTLKAVQELLAKTGNVCSFWMDQIKTHCYVMYSSVEEAIETRNAVYNLQWPPNGGRLLVAEFVDSQEVKLRVEAPQSPAARLGTTPTAPVAPAPIQLSPSTRQHGLRQQLRPPSPLRQPPPVSDPHTRRERHTIPPPQPAPKKLDLPIVTLDDLFRKTRATPRIYYLPLTEEEVASKLAMRGKDAKQ
ncbi:hypothetical protein L1049_026451 [Liquidambar formosana]|uniref:SAP domain-containing protein n=1 Tax=Liquidambar formosana TaxID=63359 RepID=A0AAP0NDB6_LIQFO